MHTFIWHTQKWCPCALSHVNGTQRKKHTTAYRSYTPENQGKKDRESWVQTVQSSRNSSMDNKIGEGQEKRDRMGYKRPRECAHFWATNVSVRSSRFSSFQAWLSPHSCSFFRCAAAAQLRWAACVPDKPVGSPTPTVIWILSACFHKVRDDL